MNKEVFDKQQILNEDLTEIIEEILRDIDE